MKYHPLFADCVKAATLVLADVERAEKVQHLLTCDEWQRLLHYDMHNLFEKLTLWVSWHGPVEYRQDGYTCPDEDLDEADDEDDVLITEDKDGAL